MKGVEIISFKRSKKPFLTIMYSLVILVVFVYEVGLNSSVLNYNEYVKEQSLIAEQNDLTGLANDSSVKEAELITKRLLKEKERQAEIQRKKIEQRKREALIKKRQAAARRRKANRAKAVKTVFTFSPFAKTNISESQYNLMLSGTGLAGKGKYFRFVEDNYGVNGLFAVAVALHESGLGRSPLPGNNYFGMIGCKFSSTGEGIKSFGRLMVGRIYKQAGKTSIESIGSTYARSSNWPSAVKQHMRSRYGRIR